MAGTSISTNPTFDVHVEAYNHHHEKLLLAFPNGKAIKALLGKTIQIPLSDFKAYLALHDLKPSPGWDSRAAIEAKGRLLWSYYRDDLEMTIGTLRTKASGARAASGLAERIGQAVGLCVIDYLHDLTEANWNRIPIGPDKDLDFWITSSKQKTVELETKGSAVPDNSFQAPVSAARKSIEEKKEKQRALDPVGVNPVRYGTIGVIDERRNSVLKCWLLDPPPKPPLFDPDRFEIVKHFGFVLNILTAITPRSPITIALANRLPALWNSDDWASLDGVRLTGWRGEPIELSISRRNRNHLAWFDTRAVLEGMNAGGELFRIADGYYLFYGLEGTLLQVAVEQAFAELRAFRVDPVFERRTVVFTTTSAEAGELGLGPMGDGNRSVRFRLSGNIAMTSAGRVFGIVQPD